MVASGDTAGLTRALEALRPIDATSVFLSGARFALYTRKPDVAARLFELLTDRRRPAAERATGYHALGFLAAARGRWREARARLDSARALRPHYGLVAWSRLALVPYATLRRPELAALRDTVLRWRTVRVDTMSGRALWEAAPEEYPVGLTASAGLISARLSDAAGVVAAARSLEERASPRVPGLDDWRAERAALLRAEALRLAGRRAEALATAPHVGVPDDRDMRDDERYLIAELASAGGRLADAVQLFGSFEQTGLQALPWAAPGHLARAELLERTGKAREAALEYERVVELWRDCDAELAPLRDEAARRAARIK
jgi:tetratricopeptide (TPR) repeat protein